MAQTEDCAQKRTHSYGKRRWLQQHNRALGVSPKKTIAYGLNASGKQRSSVQIAGNEQDQAERKNCNYEAASKSTGETKFKPDITDYEIGFAKGPQFQAQIFREILRSNAWLFLHYF